MLKIRLKRLGRKKKAFYKLVLMLNLAKRDGKSIEDLGYYDPFKKLLHLKKDRLLFYLKNGASPTNTVRHLIKKYYTFE
jgi:small subunit ribosomal protein S16|eukprot:gene23475-gene11125